MPKLDIERKQETIQVWNVCTCGEVLFSVNEAVRGECSSCWYQKMPDDTKAAMNRMISAAFRSTAEQEKDELVDDAFEKLKRDEGKQPGQEG